MDNDKKTTEEEIVLGEKELGQITDAVGKSLAPTIEAAAEKAADAAATKAADAVVAKLEDVKKKDLDKGGDAADKADDPVQKGITKGLFSEEMAKDSKEMRLFKAAKALADGDMTEVKRYNKLAQALRQKAGYANEGDVEDGGALVPDPEFDTTVYENLPNYGVAFANADVRQTDRNAVRFLSLDSGLEFYETAEAGVKRGAKMQFTKQLTDLLKYAVIVPSTDELTEDAAIDFWNLVTKELTRAYAKKADEVVFTHATSGITNTTGVITEQVSGAGTTITWDDLLSAEGAGEDDNDTSNAKWYMRKETWFRLAQTKYDGGGGAGTGGYYFQPNPNTPTTPWGTPVVFTRVLPKSNEVTANDAFAVYGDLKNYVLYNKRGMALKQLTEATIEDSEGNDFNLATQDGTAMRAVVRMLGKLPKGNAGKFVVLGTGTVS
jgi:HK97 family phage major capsid protein